MREVEDEAGRRYLLLKRSSESSLVADPESGDRRYLPNETLQAIGEDPGAPSLLERVRMEGPVTVRRLLDETTMCESELHAHLASLMASGAIREVTVAGERGYAADDDQS